MSVSMIGSASKKGAVAKTPAKAGLKTGAKQTAANKMFKNAASAARRKAINVTHGKSGQPSAPTAKGRGVFQSETQSAVFSNPKNAMSGGAYTKFVC